MTEKQYAPTKQEKKITNKVETPKQMEKVPVKDDKKVEETKKPEVSEQVQESSSKNRERKKVQKKIKRDFAIVNGKSLHISTKDAVALCNFVKRKNIDRAISDIENVLKMKKAVPMKGEIPHRKGKIMSGRFPVNSSKNFLMLLKSLKANANANNMENYFISEAVANKASRPMGRFGRWQRKRTHVFIKVSEKKSGENKN